MRLMIKSNGSSHKMWNDRLGKPTCFSQLTDGGNNAAEQKFAYKSERGLDGLLWQFRDCIDKQNGFEHMWGTPAVNEDSMQEFNQSALEDIFDMDEYCGGGLNSTEQDEIVRNFSRMCVSNRGVESELEL